MERPHGKVVGTAVMDSKLLFEVCKRIKTAAGIETLLVLAVAALNFSVVSGRIGLNQFMLDPKFSKSSLKESLFWVARAEPVCKL